MSVRTQRIDELIRRDHYFLGEQDACCFFIEYSARNGHVFGEANQLVCDLLRPESQGAAGPDVRKQRAVRRLAQAFKGAFDPARLPAVTFVPIPATRPPSPRPADDRMLRILRCVAEGLDIRDLVELADTGRSGEFAGIRTGPDVLYANMRVAQARLDPAPAMIILVGDVLTTGASFVAARKRLQQALPYVPVLGLFAARKLRDSDDPPNLDS